jgi:hypothetical protein
MYDITINPISGTLQLIHKATKETTNVNKEGKSTLNQIHMAEGDTMAEYTLPENPTDTNWIKVFGGGNKGWKVLIPQGQKVVSGMRTLDHNSYLHSNMHPCDFIHLIFLGNKWYVENKSATVGISDV